MAGKSDEFFTLDSELNETHLLPVVRALFETGVALRAANIGLVLNVKTHHRELYKAGDDKCVYNVMGAWLRKDLIEKESINRVPSWRALCKAVKSQIGGANKAAAEKIEIKFESFMTFDEQKFATADTATLDGDDSVDVQNALMVVSARWYQIGVALGLSTNTLNKCDNLQEMVEEWLKNGTNQCWKALLVAIDARYGGQNPRRAQELLPQHLQGVAGVPNTGTGSNPTLPNPGPLPDSGFDPKKPPPPTGDDAIPPGEVKDDGVLDRLFGRQCNQEIKDGFLPYPMNEKKGEKHGLALVIVNENFEQHPDHQSTDHRALSTRECAQNDRRVLVQRLEALGYRVRSEYDKTAEEIEHLFDDIKGEESENTIQESDDSFICCISSHGNRDPEKGTDVVYGTQGVGLPVEGKIVGAVNIKEQAYRKLSPLADGCRKLSKKPKMFFIQACRGVDMEKISADDNTGPGRTGPLPMRLPQSTDFFFSYATTSGKKAYRDDDGSFFIKYLCQFLETRYTSKLPLVPIIERVSQKLASEMNPFQPPNETEYTRQSPIYTSSLRGPVFFTKDAQKLHERILSSLN